MSIKSTTETIKKIQEFLEGRNNTIINSKGEEVDLRYIVNIETTPHSNKASCIFHRPGKKASLEYVEYTPFIYTKNFNDFPIKLYNGDENLLEYKKKIFGIETKDLITGDHARLKNGYPVLVTSKKSANDIYNFFKEGGIDFKEGAVDAKGAYSFKHKNLFYSVKPEEQFLISNSTRLFKGYEEYKNIHRLTFDIETTGLRHKTSRVFSIGVRDNRGFEAILEVKKKNDNAEEARLIIDFFGVINMIKPAVIVGYNSEMFDFEFLLGRAEELKLAGADIDIDKIQTTYNANHKLYRKQNSSVKFGNSSEKYTATVAWGYTILDIIHAVKRTVAVNSDIKSNKLKYIAKFEGVAKPDRMYIDGSDGQIGKMWGENKVYILNPKNNEYEIVPSQYQNIAAKLYVLQTKKKDVTEEEYKKLRNEIIIGTTPGENIEFIEYLKEKIKTHDKYQFTTGKKIVRRYLLDDLWETEQVDNLYNQSSFLLAKIVPTTYSRAATMGNAAVWNLLMTAWSYENDLAIPMFDDSIEKFSGGLVRCFKTGYNKNIVKLDFASLYPMIQLSEGVFPMFDITGVIKNMLTYMTTTRNIYKKLASGKKLNDSEIELLHTIDAELHKKYVSGHEFTKEERNLFKVKQLPIKIINNSLFGALGSGFAFLWSDTVCAARITCTGRLHLRHLVSWFKKYGCIPLLAVTDGVNFSFENTTWIGIDGNRLEKETPIDEAWVYGEKKGISALVEKFNKEEMKPPFMSVDNDGVWKASLNLSRINYANMSEDGKIKLTGNTIKSKILPEYIEDFIDKGLTLILEGKGQEFIEYYYDYLTDIYYKRIPLKKIATKKKFKVTIKDYRSRGTDKNGRAKGKQAQMELIISERIRLENEKFKEVYKEIFNEEPPAVNIEFLEPSIDDLILVRGYIGNKLEGETKELAQTKLSESVEFKTLYIKERLIDYMPPEPELDSILYYVNIGTLQSHGDSAMITNKKTGETYLATKLIDTKQLEENPDLTGEYNVAKYIAGFNKRVTALLEGFSLEVRDTLLVKNPEKRNYYTQEQSKLQNFDNDDFEQSMYLEEPEINFWNRTGYDPTKIWDGFKLPENTELRTKNYRQAIKQAEDKISKAKGRHIKVKSVDDELVEGDPVLIKNYEDYTLGRFNGTYIEIIRESFPIELSPEEIEDKEKRLAALAKGIPPEGVLVEIEDGESSEDGAEDME